MQHYLTMLGATVLIPFLLVPAMGGTSIDLAHVIGTIFFMSGWITLLQTVVGDRLPIVQVCRFCLCARLHCHRSVESAVDYCNHTLFAPLQA